MGTKVCSKCSIEKNVCEFYLDKQKKDNLSSSCKICKIKQYDIYKLENPDKVKESKRKEYLKNIERYRKHNENYRNLNNDKIKNYLIKYYFEHKEIICNRHKERYQQKKEEILCKQKEYHQKNFEKRRNYHKNYVKINKEKLREYKLIYTKKRRKDDILFYLKGILSHRVRQFLKTKKMKKNNKTFNMIGCSPEFLKEHLEKQFVDGMNWENRGDWHIDHILPLSSAQNEDEIYKLCHYTNLQPLWAEDNIKKSNKIVEPVNSQIND
jgi:hypothetical protein